MGKTKKCYFLKTIFRYSLRNLVKPKDMKGAHKSCKSLMNYQENTNVKDKIKTNIHFYSKKPRR